MYKEIVGAEKDKFFYYFLTPTPLDHLIFYGGKTCGTDIITIILDISIPLGSFGITATGTITTIIVLAAVACLSWCCLCCPSLGWRPLQCISYKPEMKE